MTRGHAFLAGVVLASAVRVAALRLPGTLRAGRDVERLCALADESRAYLTLVANAPLRTGGPE